MEEPALKHECIFSKGSDPEFFLYTKKNKHDKLEISENKIIQT